MRRNFLTHLGLPEKLEKHDILAFFGQNQTILVSMPIYVKKQSHMGYQNDCLTNAHSFYLSRVAQSCQKNAKNAISQEQKQLGIKSKFWVLRQDKEDDKMHLEIYFKVASALRVATSKNTRKCQNSPKMAKNAKNAKNLNLIRNFNKSQLRRSDHTSVSLGLSSLLDISQINNFLYTL